MVPEATWAQSSLAVPAQVPELLSPEERLISGRFLRRKPVVVARVLQRNRTIRIYREENSCPRSQQAEGVLL